MEPLPDSGTGTSAKDGGNVPTLEDPEPEAMLEVAAPKPTPPVQVRVADRPAATPAKHIAKDYGYVRAEVRRIALVAGFLIVALVITAILRN